MTDDPRDEWYSDAHATLGDRLTGAREAAGLTPSDLARNLGLRLKTVESWENDQAEPRANRLQMLAGLLNVSIRWLLTGQGDGLDGPADATSLPPGAAGALAELAALRARSLTLAQDLGQAERRLRAVLRAAS